MTRPVLALAGLVAAVPTGLLLALLVARRGRSRAQITAAVLRAELDVERGKVAKLHAALDRRRMPAALPADNYGLPPGVTDTGVPARRHLAAVPNPDRV